MGWLDVRSRINTSSINQKDHTIDPSRCSVACMINSEIGAVLAVMRRNVRWGIHYMVDEDQVEHSLIHSLKELRRKIFLHQHDWNNLDPIMYLQPFLDVIQSDETGAPITGVALSSIYKILALDILSLHTIHLENAMHLIVEAVTRCRFEVTDPASEEVVLMKILQVLLACMKSQVSAKLSNQHVCNIVNTCFRIVHQASLKGELLQRIARHTTHELVRCIFSHVPETDYSEFSVAIGGQCCTMKEICLGDAGSIIENSQLDNNNAKCQQVSQSSPGDLTSKGKIESNNGVEPSQTGSYVMLEAFGIPCMIEILHFLCSLLNVEHIEAGSRASPTAYEEDVPLFALGLINSAIELGGDSFSNHPQMLALIQDELFLYLMQFGLSMSPLILSTVCSIALNLQYHFRKELKLQFEAFFSCVLLMRAQTKHRASYQLQEVAMEALVDFCRQQTFTTEMYANFDCNISCSNVFEDLVSVLSRSTFPVNIPLSETHILALNGLIAIVQCISERAENIGSGLPNKQSYSFDPEGYREFWSQQCDSYSCPDQWIPFVRKMKHAKRQLTAGIDHFNQDPKRGIEVLRGMGLLPDKLGPQSVACFLRYTHGLDKNAIGDFLGNHDGFCVLVLHEFARTFDFHDMNLDTALRIFLETFRLPGESQKIQRVLEAFAERYYEQSPKILTNKDAALLLSYSIIMLNTDQHNIQVKKKMTEEDFIRNNRRINGGSDLPREFLSELYHSICENEIRMAPEHGAGFPVMTASHWVGLLYKSRKSTPYIICDSVADLDYDMFSILSGPAIAAISVVLDNVERKDVIETCITGFLAVAKISAFYHLHDVLDDLVVSLCKFTTLMDPSSIEDSLLALSEDGKAKTATATVFEISNTYGDDIRESWKNILDCVLSLHELRLLPHLVTDAAEDSDMERSRPGRSSSSSNTSSSQKSSGLISRFSQLLSFETEEATPQPTEEDLAAHESVLQAIQGCRVENIFSESKFLPADSLLKLSQALILAAGRSKNENTAVFCLELLIVITLNNRDRILLIWRDVYDHISNVVQSITMPCTLVERAVFGLLKICQRLLPYKEDLSDEFLKSLQLILKLDARVADAYCEPITIEVSRLIKANAASIKSHSGWRAIISLLSITARHPEASEPGFDALVFVMADGRHLLPANYTLCIDAASGFAESCVGHTGRSLRAVDLMAESAACLGRWSEAVAESGAEAIGEMWLKMVQGVKKVCLDRRSEVRNHALPVLQRCAVSAGNFHVPNTYVFQCFDHVIFELMDELLEIQRGSSLKYYKDMDRSVLLSVKLLAKVFLQFLQDLALKPSFCRLWVGVLTRIEGCMLAEFRGRRSEKLRELVPELLKNTLLVMKTSGILVPDDPFGGDSFWKLTWLHMKNIAPLLQQEVFPDQSAELQREQDEEAGNAVQDGSEGEQQRQ